MNRLLYTRFFPPRNGKSWPWYIKTVVEDIPRVVKFSWQRTKRGWADCDAWSMNGWFADVVPDMLRQLRDNNIGYPMPFEHLGDDLGPETWKEILTQMLEDLEAVQRYNDKWFGDEGLYDMDGGLEQTKRCIRDENEAQRIVKRGLFEFYVWFFYLWD